MAFKAGYQGDFRLDNAGGTLTDIRPYIDTVSVTQSNETLDVSALGTVSKSYLTGMQDGQVSFSGPYDTTIAQHLSGLRAAHAAGTATFSFQWGPGGSTSGEAQVTGECILTSYDLSTGTGGRAEYSASLQLSGTITNGTF